MAKDPAFLFYPNDWIGGTLGMSFQEKGAYVEVLMMQFNRGHMTEDMIGHAVGQLWGQIKHKFIQDEQGLWYNVRLEIEQEKRRGYVKSRKNNKLGNNQHTKNKKNEEHMTGHTEGHMTSHMENENENEDKGKVEGKSKVGVRVVGEGEEKGKEEEKGYADAYEEMVLPSMKTLWKKHNPKYAFDKKRDFAPLLKIAEFICEQDGLNPNSITNSKKHILEVFGMLCPFIMADNWYRNYNLSQVEKYIQSITSKFQNGQQQATGAFVSTQSAFDKIDLLYSQNGAGGY